MTLKPGRMAPFAALVAALMGAASCMVAPRGGGSAAAGTYPAGAADRAFWVACLDRICRPVMEAQAAGTLGARLPRRNPAKANPQSAPLEAFARTLTGIAPWLELGPDGTPEGKLRAEYIRLARQGIVNSVDTNSPGYLDYGHEAQSLVEDAYLVQAFWRAPRELWEPLPAATKEAVCRDLLRNRWDPQNSNWLFFGALPHLFVLEKGTPAQKAKVNMARIRKAPEKFMDEFYKGDGWYGDGAAFHMDKYNSYVIHPMLWDQIEHMKALGLPDAAKWEQAEMPRFRRYADYLERTIMPDGTYAQIGRSGQYRFGCFQVLSMACWMDRFRPGDAYWPTNSFRTHNRPVGSIRAALTAVLRRQCVDANFDAEGWLTIGFNGTQPWGAEAYATRGSQYLCTEIFMALGLPPAAPFWTAPGADWTQRQIWSGGHYPIDGYLHN